VAEAGDVSGRRVLEIGAGLGSLTRPLGGRGANVLAIEFDRALIPALREIVADLGTVEVLQANALSAPWRELLDEGPWLVVGNLPYNVAVPILLRLLEEAPDVDEYVVMVQREVAERLSAVAGEREYGPTSVRVAFHANADVVRSVPPSVFWPRPHVGSSVLRLRPHAPEVDVDAVRLFGVVDVAFAGRRKTMRSAVRRLGVKGDRVSEVLEAAGIERDARPETVTLEGFAALAELVPHPAGADG
jgi:16S rRNA (adenine1518-N6/adenine1519-N6)-dimethyltransferase